MEIKPLQEKDSNSMSPAKLAWMRFKKNRQSLFGLLIIALALIVAVLGANIRPDGSKDANTQQLSISRKPPGFQVLVLRMPSLSADAGSPSFFSGLFFGGKPRPYVEIPLHSYELMQDSLIAYTYAGEDHIAGVPLAFHLLEISEGVIPGTAKCNAGICSGTLPDGSSTVSITDERLKADVLKNIKSMRFILGTDKFGRDLLSRLMAGTIVSLSVGLISVIISLLIGVGLGAIAGYYGGLIDDMITWLINVVWSIPTLLLVIAITFALGKGFVQVFIAVGLTMWVEVARVMRGQVMSLKKLEYVEAARALGYSTVRIITRHLVPNAMGPVIVISAANFASAILLEAGLSFLGIGAQIPMASWGQMIKDHYAYITTDMAYLALIPGFCIILLVLAFMLVGAGLRDAFDTRSTA